MIEGGVVSISAMMQADPLRGCNFISSSERCLLSDGIQTFDFESLTSAHNRSERIGVARSMIRRYFRVTRR